MLKFSPANVKIRRLLKIPELQPYFENKRKVYSLDLLSGWTCPGAQDCLSRVVERGGKRRVQDGRKTKFRCFSASQEALYKTVYGLRQHNTVVLENTRSVKQCVELLERNLPPDLGILRYHVGGDFFKLQYLRAAYEVARNNPKILFYGYTKSLLHLMKLPIDDPSNGVVLPNFLLTGSRGGKYDSLIDQIGIRTATVVFAERGTDLPIDHDDSHSATIGGSFALLLHGTQPKGSTASKALVQLKGKGSYR